MAGRHLRTLIQHLRRCVCPHGEDTLSDTQLLERWVQQRDEAAFEVLLWRHGPMVLSVCRRLLRESHDVEDAFQAAFLTLVHKGASIRRPEALAAWLYRVAYRIALRLRRESAERTQREQAGVETLASMETDESSRGDLRAVLDEELDALPERYRQAIVLCHMQGKTHAEAARLLGRPTGTISCWLKRGRERLRERLARRGFTSAALAAFGESEARALLPAALVRATGRAATVFAAGSGDASAISARVAALVDSAAKGTAATKLQWTLVLGFVLSMTAAGAGMWVYHPSAEPEAEAPEQPRKQEEQSVRTDRHGDPLPKGAVAQLGTVRLRHWRISDRVAISPDGKHAATTGYDEAVRLWSISTGKLVWSRQKSHVAVFSPNSKLLAASDKTSVCLLDTTTGRLIRRIPTKDVVHTFSPDGKFLVTSSNDPIVRVWEIATGRCISEMKVQGTLGVAVVTPDGRTLVTGNLSFPRTICHWDLAEGKLRKTLKTDAPRSKTIGLSPDGRTFAVVPAGREAVRLYDTDTGKLRCQLQGDPAAGRYGLSFSSDGRLLATNWAESFADEVTISIWDAGTGKPLRRFRVPQGHVDCLFLAPDGRKLLTMPREFSTLHVWDSVTGEPLLNWPAHTGPINALMFTPDGRQLVSSDNKTLRLWETSSGRHLRELGRETWGFRDLAVTPDGRGVVAGGYLMARLRDLATGEEQRRFLLDEHPEKVPEHPHTLLGHSVQHLSLSANGQTVVCIGVGPRELQPGNWVSMWEAHIWDFSSGRLLAHRDLGSKIEFIGITPDARTAIESRIVTRNEANSYQLVLHDLRTGQRLVTLNLPDSYRFDTCAVSPDGRTLVTAMATAAQDKKGMNWGASTIRFWELASGKERQRIAPPQTGWEFIFGKFAIAPDGRTLATDRNDRTLQLWDAVTGKELLRRSGFDSEVTALAFAPDRRSLATGHGDSTILIWDMGALQISAERSSHAPDAKELEQWWSALAGEDAHAAWTAIWKMAAAPRHVLPLLRQRLKPAVAFPADEADRLIDDLDSSDFAKREAASKRLAAAGERVVPALEKALKAATSLEKRRRIKDLLPTSDIVRSRDVLQAVRAIEVLEHIGTAEAQQILKTLAQGMPEARVTREAKKSLERLRARVLAGKR